MDYNELNKKEEYRSIYGEISNSIIIEKKSKFICYIFNISNDVEAEDYINLIKSKNKDARHVVYIYSYFANNNVNVRFSDDGEPQGTGTKAIYEMLTKEKITNVCIVIVRYFGGILLGAGPLSRTYLTSAKSAIKNTSKETLHIYEKRYINVEYENYDNIMNKLKEYIKNRLIVVCKTDYLDNIKIEIDVDKSIIDEIEEV